MHIDFVVPLVISKPTGVVNRDNLVNYSILTELDENSELLIPTKLKCSDAIDYFEDQDVITWLEQVPDKEIYFIGPKANFATVTDVTFWMIVPIDVLTSVQWAEFKGWAIRMFNASNQDVITWANTPYRAAILDGNIVSSAVELVEAFLESYPSMNDMQFRTMVTFDPVLTTDDEYSDAFNNNLIFVNTPDAGTPTPELSNLKMGGISWARLFYGEYIKQLLQVVLKQTIQTKKLKMVVEDYVILENEGNKFLKTFINQGVIGSGAFVKIPKDQTSADQITGTIKNAEIDLEGVNSAWRLEGILNS